METPHLSDSVVSEHTHLRLPSLPQWIEPTVQYLLDKAMLAGVCTPSRGGKLMLALHEALSNSIIHGNLDIASALKEKDDTSYGRELSLRISDPRYAKRCVDVEIDYDGRRCQWTVTDEGNGFDVDGVLKRCLSDEPEVLLASGRGILLMRSFLDEVRFELGGRRLILVLRREEGEEKRLTDRVQTGRTVRIVPLLADGSASWDEAYEAVTHNVSKTGIGFVQDRLLQAKNILIGLDGTDPMVYVPAEVKHCEASVDNMVLLGCQFLSHDGSPESKVEMHDDLRDAIERLTRSAAMLPGDERRGDPRVLYNERVEVAERAVVTPGYARDLSKGGMAIIMPMALTGEVIVTITPQDEGPALGVVSEVVRCVKITDGFFDVGVRFLRLEDRT